MSDLQEKATTTNGNKIGSTAASFDLRKLFNLICSLPN